jgi:hypothetical protein
LTKGINPDANCRRQVGAPPVGAIPLGVNWAAARLRHVVREIRNDPPYLQPPPRFSASAENLITGAAAPARQKTRHFRINNAAIRLPSGHGAAQNSSKKGVN